MENPQSLGQKLRPCPSVYLVVLLKWWSITCSGQGTGRSLLPLPRMTLMPLLPNTESGGKALVFTEADSKSSFIKGILDSTEQSIGDLLTILNTKRRQLSRSLGLHCSVIISELYCPAPDCASGCWEEKRCCCDSCFSTEACISWIDMSSQRNTIMLSVHSIQHCWEVLIHASMISS